MFSALENKIEIFFQVDKIHAAMSMDKKDPFQRLSKLLEEQGELLEAYFDNADIVDSIEEAIDNVLVTASIAYVIAPDSLVEMEAIFNNHYQKDYDCVVDKELINLTINNGKVSDAVQKYLKVGASCYKGSMTVEDTVNEIAHSIFILAKVLRKLVKIQGVHKIDYVNSIIEKKNAKWMEKSLFGQQVLA